MSTTSHSLVRREDGSNKLTCVQGYTTSTKLAFFEFILKSKVFMKMSLIVEGSILYHTLRTAREHRHKKGIPCKILSTCANCSCTTSLIIAEPCIRKYFPPFSRFLSINDAGGEDKTNTFNNRTCDGRSSC